MSELYTDFSVRLRDCRKAKKLSQRQLAELLNISFQSVSKWETGNGVPSLSILPRLADVLEVSCDELTGHEPRISGSKYEDLYRQEAFFWGTQPNDLSYQLLQRFSPSEYPRLLELGCGEGRDAVFFGQNGYRVTAIDMVSSGIQKGIRQARARNADVEFLCSNILSFSSKTSFDIICGFRILHYLLPNERADVIARYQNMTRVGGIHAFTVCVTKPFVPVAPDNETTTYPLRSGELFTFYADWEILFLEEKIVDCNSSGIPHRHPINTIIARKVR